MSIEIDITSSFIALEKALTNFKKNEVVMATRRALNRTVISVRKESGIEIKSNYSGLKAGEIKRDYMRLRKAKGNTLKALEGAVSFSSKPVSMIRMVKGSKQPRAQKGKKVANRTPVRAQIKRGKTFVMKKAFIARVNAGGGKDGNTHVFKRDGKRLIKQSLPSVGIMLDKEGKLKRIGADGQRFFEKTLSRELEFRMKRIQAKLNRQSLTR